jgi:hypothetical protein
VSVVNLRELKPGTRVKLINGSEAEILENPADGMWVFGRILQNGAAAGSDEEPIFAHDIVEIIS